MSLVIKSVDHPQVKDRRFAIWTDQHGRQWEAQESKETGKPAELLRPRGWRAPVKGGLPPHRYLRVANDPENPRRLTIHYDGIIEEYRRLDDEWLARLLREGRRLNKSTFDPEHPSEEVLDVVGPRPFPWQYWLACKDANAEGHEWALGLSKERPSWADQYFARRDDGAAFLYRKPEDEKANASANAQRVRTAGKREPTGVGG